MRRVLGISVVFLGALVCVLLFNMFLCSIVTTYKDVIKSMVSQDPEIPVVEVSEGVTIVRQNNEVRYITPETETSSDEEDASMKEANEYFDNLGKKSESEASQDACGEAPVIVDRQYYEDCGTGKGYWVLTYEDGRKVVE